MSEWRMCRLADLITIKHGFAFKGEFITDAETQNLLLTPGNFAIGGGFQFKKMKFYSGEVPKDYILCEGDLLVTMTDLSKEADTLGYSAVVPRSDRTMLHNQRLGKVALKSPETTLDFLHWLLRTPDYRHEILSNYSGSTVKHTSPSKILAYEFSLPPIETQSEIAAVLGALDDKIELNRKTTTTLEEMARALYRSWFVDFDPVHAKAQGRAPAHMDPATAALFPDSFGEDGLPEGWEVRPLLDIMELMSGGTPKTSNQDFWDGDIPWASAKDVSQCGQAFLISTERKITPAGLAKSSTKMIPAYSTVVVARGATTGRACMFGSDIAMNQTCYALKSRSGEPFFANCMFMTEVLGITLAAHGSVFDTITTKTLQATSIVAPSRALSARFEEMVSPMFQRILEMTNETKTLATLRDTLLPRLMSGELRVGEAKELVEDVA